jgi:hypothetical protein
VVYVVNRPKKQGTAAETAFVTAARGWGLVARRLPEGGSLDVGDVEVHTPDGDTWVVEVKHRTALNVHQTLHKARVKAGPRHSVAVVWKRSVRKGGNTRRTPDGEPVVVAVRLADFLALLSRPVCDHKEGAA